MSKNIDLTILIPCYNEEKLIKENLTEIISFLSHFAEHRERQLADLSEGFRFGGPPAGRTGIPLPTKLGRRYPDRKVVGASSKKKYSWEVLVVDDGSSDGSIKKIRELKNSDIRLITYKVNKGKGAALKEGVKNSLGKYIIFMDADLSVPIETVDVFLENLEKEDSEVVIGTRKIKNAKVLVHQPWLRENLGKGFTFITRLITGVYISDFTCGFKGFSGSSAKKIFSHSLLVRWAYDAEILFLAKKYGYKITEIPVTWINRKDTRVKLGNAVITSFIDLVKLKLNDWSGKYGN